jgi:RND family efflux transporter MFP subunit
MIVSASFADAGGAACRGRPVVGADVGAGVGFAGGVCGSWAAAADARLSVKRKQSSSEGTQRIALSDCVSLHAVKWVCRLGKDSATAVTTFLSVSGISCELCSSMRRALLIYAVLILAGVAILAVVFPRRGHIAAPSVGVAAVTQGQIRREVLTSGVLEPKSSVDIGSQVSGTIQSISADFNSRVKAGQVLAQIDPAPYDTMLAQARAEKVQADAEAERLRNELADLGTKETRAVELAAGGLITQAELDAAKMAARQAAAAVKAAIAASGVAAAGVKEAEVNRERTTIRSPMDGVVVSRNVEVGQTIAASFQSPVLFRVADLRRMQLLADVGESEAGDVRRGVPVTFQIESIGPQEFGGVISEVRLAPVQEQGSTGTSGTTTTGTPTAATTTSTSTSTPTSQSSAGSSTAPAPTGTAGRSTSGSQTSSGSTSRGTATGSAATTSSSPTSPAGTVVSYTAVIEVDNPDGAIVPGSTAVVTLPTAQRDDVIRVPNAALSFRPTPDALKATGQEDLKWPVEDRAAGGAAGQGVVFKYDGGKFVPIPVETGASDERWTEVRSENVPPGDQLVTQISVPKR